MLAIWTWGSSFIYASFSFLFCETGDVLTSSQGCVQSWTRFLPPPSHFTCWVAGSASYNLCIPLEGNFFLLLKLPRSFLGLSQVLLCLFSFGSLVYLMLSGHIHRAWGVGFTEVSRLVCHKTSTREGCPVRSSRCCRYKSLLLCPLFSHC